MNILVADENLMWTTRLAKSLRALGHSPVLTEKMPQDNLECEVAIINLGSKAIPCQELVPKLKEWGVKIIAHAGHKELELLQLGEGLGCDVLCTNSELTWKTESVLNKIEIVF